MRPREALKSKRVRVGVIVTVMLAAGGGAVLASSNATSSAIQECMRGFTAAEREQGPQWLKEKIEGREQECRSKAHLRERTPQQWREIKERFAASHPRPAPSNGSGRPNSYTGIIESHEPPPGMKGSFYVSNRWVGTVAGEKFIVAAGATTRIAAGNVEYVRPAVIVFRESEGATSAEGPTHVATRLAGGEERPPLTIAQEEGDMLRLKTATGKEFLFDVATLTLEPTEGPPSGR